MVALSMEFQKGNPASNYAQCLLLAEELPYEKVRDAHCKIWN